MELITFIHHKTGGSVIMKRDNHPTANSSHPASQAISRSAIISAIVYNPRPQVTVFQPNCHSQWRLDLW